MKASVLNFLTKQINTQKLFGIVMFVNYIAYFFVFDYGAEHVVTSLVLRVIASALCFSLIFLQYDENSFSKRLYWQLVLTYCLPFFFAFMSFMNDLSTIWLMNSVSAVFFLIILLELRIFLKLFSIGLIAAVFLYKYILGYDFVFHPGIVSLGDIFATYFAVIVIGSLFALNRDIIVKERKNYSDKLAELNDSLEQRVVERTLELEDALKVKTEFLNNMSHEIRTPVQGFMGISEGLELHWSMYDDEQKYKYTREIAKNAKRLASLVGSLLDLTKFNKGNFYLDLGEFDLAKVVNDMIDESKTLYLNNKNIDISLERLDESFEMTGDIERIGQVLRNLFINAIKFSPSNSKIIIKLIKKEAELQFSIIDQGVGVPEEELNSIFDSFVQSSRTKTQAGGVGLGLSICKKIIMAHHGKIWAENNQDRKGATFHFIIPISQSIEHHIHKPLELSKIRNVIIIDDEESMLAVMSIILRSHDYTVMQSSSGIEGLKLIQEHYKDLDLIFLDLMMPDMHGIEVLKAIKQDPWMKEIPVIIQSGAADINDKQKCFDLGAEAFLNKPYTSAMVLEEIANIQKAIANSTIAHI